MLDVLAVAFHERCARAHAHHDHAVQLALVSGSQTVGNELLTLRCGQTVDALVDIGCSHTGQHHVFHLVEGNPVVVQVFSEGSVERCDGVGSLDADRADNHAAGVDTYYLGRRNAYVYSDYYLLHLNIFLYFVFAGAKLRQKKDTAK